MLEFDDASSIAADRAALRRRLCEDGYLFFRGLLDAEMVNDVASQAFAVLAAHGWFESTSDDGPRRLATPPRFGAEGRSPHGDSGYESVTALECMQRLGYDPDLTRVMRTLVGEDLFPLPSWAQPTPQAPYPPRGSVLRTVYPARDVPLHNGMYEHQDYRVFGIADMFTVWVPLIPIDRNLGGLLIRKGGHRHGVIQRRLMEPAPDWATTDYQVGDVLVFHALTPHAALPNNTDQLRLSIDVRFQSARVPLLSVFAYGIAGHPSFVDHPVTKCDWWEPVPSTVTLIERDLFGPEPPLTGSEFVPVPGFPAPAGCEGGRE